MTQLTKQPILDSDPTHSTRSRPFNERVSRVFAPPRPDTTPPEQRGPPRPTQHVALPSPRLLLTLSTVHSLLVPSCLSTSKHTSPPTNCPTWRRIAGVGRAPKICSFHHDGQRVEAANPIATGYDGRSDKHGLQLFFQLISPMRSGTPPPPIAIFVASVPRPGHQIAAETTTHVRSHSHLVPRTLPCPSSEAYVCIMLTRPLLGLI